jgi:N-acetylglucosaminyl-diphospho-decaprenol L-rhamnosyltransferase
VRDRAPSPHETHMSSLAVIIVNYKTADLACQCMESLEPEIVGLPGSEVCVVDNDSGDGSAERLARFVEERSLGSWVRVLRAPRNGGFAAGNNVALRELLPEGRHAAFLLLNPDTYVRPGALRALVDRLDSDPAVGIVGSQLEYPDGSLQGSAFRFPSPMSELEVGIDLGLTRRLLARWATMYPQSDAAQRCDWVGGASLLIRREVLESVGLLDEEYFLYFEEVDYCFRTARAGWTCWQEPASRVVHLEGQATGLSDPRHGKKKVPQYWFDSRRRFFLKNYGPATALAADVGWLAGRSAGSLGRWIRDRIRAQKEEDLPEGMLRDFIRNSVLARGFRL